MSPRARFEPFALGMAAAVLLPLVALGVLALFGDLTRWFEAGAAYGLMPVFAILGVPAFVVTRLLRTHYARRGQSSMFFTNGLAAGGWLAGTLILWVAQPGEGFAARLLGSLSGGLMLVAFWLWIGSLLAHVFTKAESGPEGQSQSLTSQAK